MKHFIVNLSFKAPRGTLVPRRLFQHDMHFRAGCHLGLLLLYGPRNPPDGFLAIARAESRHTLDAFLQEDPLVVDQVATVEILEFQPIGFPGMLRDWVNPLSFGNDPDCAGTYGVFI